MSGFPSLADWRSAAPRLGLKWASSQFSGPCPHCGGKDRFRVLSNGKFFCRQCCPDGSAKDSMRLILDAAGFPMPERPVRPDPKAERAHREAEKASREREAVRVAARHSAVARTAQGMIKRATIETHPYLVIKGFPEHRALVLNRALILPMRPIEGYKEIASVQEIQTDGSKKFLPGGRAKGCVLHIGQGREQWWCEGYATGLSIQAALARLYRRARVTVCFSAQNLAHVAKRGFVVADHDRSGAGMKAAVRTGLPYWMPPMEGDANDYHLDAGINTLANELRNFSLI